MLKIIKRLQTNTLKEQGFFSVELGLALIIASIAAVATLRANSEASAMTQASAQADQMISVAKGVESLVFEKYLEYQQGLIVSKGGVNLPSGVIDGQSYAPTIAQLRAMGLGLDSIPDTGTYKSLESANWRVRIQRVPIGCEAAPNPLNGSACNITGQVCFDQPLRNRDQVVGESDTLGISTIIGRIGGNAGFSVEGASNVITRFGGGTMIPNFLPGNPPGVICTMFGFGSAGFANFLRVNDSRDPNFQGGATVNGLILGSTYTLAINGNSNITGTANIGGDLNVAGSSTFNGTATFNGPLNLNDDILLRDPLSGQTCVRILRTGRVDINSVASGSPACQGILNARIATLTDAGGQTARVGDTGTGFIVDATGRIRGTQGFWSAVGSLFGDNNLGVRVAGTVFTIQTGAVVDAVAVHDQGRFGARVSVATPVLGLIDPVAIGQACTNPASEVPATNVTAAATTVIRALVGGGFASCISGQWSPAGQIGIIGGFCPTDGMGAFTSVGVLLICSGNQYISMAARFGRLTTAEFWRVADGQSVPKPICASGSSGTKLVLTAGNEEQRTQRLNRSLLDTGAAWTVFMRDGLNTVIDGDMIATSYCIY